MKSMFAFVPAAIAAIAIVATPAAAKTKKHHRAPHGYYAQPYQPNPGAPLVSRNVSDPSFGYHPGLDYARQSGRCVEDLGYGRFEYCGW